jgi:hypothetical protein
MQLIAPDILLEARGLSYPFSILGIVLGVMLWALGWHWHRFWIVFFATVGAGILGLNTQQVLGPRMLAAGLLLGVAVGMMSLDLSRFLAFYTGGVICWFAVHAIVPSFQEPLICFLGGGIVGLFLYRLQWMLLSALVGILVAGHCAMLVIEKSSKMEFVAADWAKAHSLSLTIGTAALAVAGLIVQGQLERWRSSKGARDQKRAMANLSEDERTQVQKLRSSRGLVGFLRQHV